MATWTKLKHSLPQMLLRSRRIVSSIGCGRNCRASSDFIRQPTTNELRFSEQRISRTRRFTHKDKEPCVRQIRADATVVSMQTANSSFNKHSQVQHGDA